MCQYNKRGIRIWSSFLDVEDGTQRSFRIIKMGIQTASDNTAV